MRCELREKAQRVARSVLKVPASLALPSLPRSAVYQMVLPTASLLLGDQGQLPFQPRKTFEWQEADATFPPRDIPPGPLGVVVAKASRE